MGGVVMVVAVAGRSQGSAALARRKPFEVRFEPKSRLHSLPETLSRARRPSELLESTIRRKTALGKSSGSWCPCPRRSAGISGLGILRGPK